MGGEISIYNEADWNGIGEVTQHITLESDIVFTSQPNNIDLKSYTFDGQNHTITLPNISMESFIDMNYGNIKNLRIDASNKYIKYQRN